LRKYRFPFFWALLIGLISLLPDEDMPPLNQEDKWAHVVFYAVLTFLLARARSRQLKVQKRVLANFVMAFLIAAIYGAIIEIIQLYFIPGRHGDLMDLLANLIGGVIAFPLHWLLNVKRR